MEKLNEKIVGISDYGYPLVSSSYSCTYFKRQVDSLFPIEECWYCAYADFRKSDVHISVSLCRHPYNRVIVSPSKYNENL